MNYEPLPEKIRRGWSLTRSSWGLVRHSKALLILPLVWFVLLVALLVGYGKIGLGMYIQKQGPDTYYLGSHIGIWSLLWLVAFYATAVLANTLFVAVVAHNVLMRLSGAPVSVTGSLRAVWQRFGMLAGFSLFTSGVSFILANTLGRIPFLGGILGWTSSTSWQTTTAFAVPAIMAQPETAKMTPLGATKASAGTIVKAWGEGVTYKATISVIALFVIAGTYITGTLIERVFYLGLNRSEAVLIVGAIVGTLLFLAEYLTFSLLSMVLRTVLYAYSVNGSIPKDFDKKMLHATVTRRKAQRLFS